MQRKGKGAVQSPLGECINERREATGATDLPPSDSLTSPNVRNFAKRKGAAGEGHALFFSTSEKHRLGGQFLGLVMDDRGLVQDLEDLGECRFLVGLLHCAEFTSQAR